MCVCVCVRVCAVGLEVKLTLLEEEEPGVECENEATPQGVKEVSP